jgi:hypothetical protein
LGWLWPGVLTEEAAGAAGPSDVGDIFGGGAGAGGGGGGVRGIRVGMGHVAPAPLRAPTHVMKPFKPPGML